MQGLGIEFRLGLSLLTQNCPTVIPTWFDQYLILRKVRAKEQGDSLEVFFFFIISLFLYGLYKWKETKGLIFILSNYYRNQIKQQMRKRKCRIVRTSLYDNNLSMKQAKIVFPLGMRSNWTITVNLLNENKHEWKRLIMLNSLLCLKKKQSMREIC